MGVLEQALAQYRAGQKVTPLSGGRYSIDDNPDRAGLSLVYNNNACHKGTRTRTP